MGGVTIQPTSKAQAGKNATHRLSLASFGSGICYFILFT